MKSTKPNETITVSIYDGKAIKNINITLAKSPRGDYGFMGVLIGGDYISGSVLGYSDGILLNLKSIPSQLINVKGWLYVVAMPFMFQGFSGELLNYFTPIGFWKDLGNTIFYLLNTLYWIGWINFYVGLFNCLPAIPLDGGRVLQEVLMSIFKGNKGKDISALIVKTLAIAIFLSIALSIIIPNLPMR
jgi:membrane-associated protease RseP (regulator of RpoE activity)